MITSPYNEKKLGEFGIGCIQFRPKNLDESFTSYDCFVERLEVSLGHIAAIHDIKVRADNDFDNFSEGLPQPFSLASKGEYPDLSSGGGITLELTLRMKIPERTQKEILEEYHGTVSGDLIVYFSYQYDMPLMFVYLDKKANYDISPSTCVRLVREFLKSEMENNANCEFTIDTLGPSPFHADFTVFTSEEVSDIKSRTTVMRGYDDVSIVAPITIDTWDELISHLEEHLFGDFDTYYMIMLERIQVMNAWYSCLNEVTKLEQVLKGESRWRHALRQLLPTAPTYELASQIAEFRLTNASALGRINERLIEDALIKQSPIWINIEREQKTFPKYDVESLEKLVEFIDRKQTHKQSIANTAFSAIFGAIAGALVAWVMQPPNHAPSQPASNVSSEARSQVISAPSVKNTSAKAPK